MGPGPAASPGYGLSATRSAPGPRVVYRWALIWAVALTEMTSWGILYYAFSVFLEPIERELGWSRAQLTGAFSLAILASGLAAVPVGRWLDRRGPRLLMTAGSVAGSVLVLALSTVTSLVQLYVIWFGIGLVMATVLYEPAFYIVATWFRHERGRALSILTLLGGLASTIYLPIAGLLVATLGWRSALVVLGLILAVATIPLHATVLPRHPRDAGSNPARAGSAGNGAGDSGPPPTGGLDGAGWRGAVRHKHYWWLVGAFSLQAFTSVAVSFHLVAYLVGAGLGPAAAASAAGLVGLFSVGGRLALAPLWDRVSRPRLAGAAFVLVAVSVVLLIAVPGPVGVTAFIVLFGAGRGSLTPLRAGLLAEQFGDRGVATLGGILAAVVTVMQAIAPLAAGVAYDLAGGYGPVFAFSAGLSTIAAVAVARTGTGA